MFFIESFDHSGFLCTFVETSNNTEKRNDIMGDNKPNTYLEEFRREELIQKIERTVNNLTLEELEALHYDMLTKNYINDDY